MDYGMLGQTGLKVSVLSFGGSSLGEVFREVDEPRIARAPRVCPTEEQDVFGSGQFKDLFAADGGVELLVLESARFQC